MNVIEHTAFIELLTRVAVLEGKVEQCRCDISCVKQEQKPDLHISPSCPCCGKRR